MGTQLCLKRRVAKTRGLDHKTFFEVFDQNDTQGNEVDPLKVDVKNVSGYLRVGVEYTSTCFCEGCMWKWFK